MRAITLFLTVALLSAPRIVRGAEPVAQEQSATNAPSVAKEPPVTKEQALAAIAMLETNAASDAGVDASNTIIKFAQESHAVIVRLNPATVPWARVKAPEGQAVIRQILLAAYIGGNSKAQLMAPQDAKDDPYDGWRLAIDVYHQIRQKKPDIVIPEIDALAQKQKTGELKRYADEIENKQPKP